MTDNTNGELAAGSTDDRRPMTEGLLTPDEIEDRVDALRAGLVRLERDPAEAARIDALIAEADAMFGPDLTPFEDPPSVTAAAQRDAFSQGRPVVISGSHAQPRVEAGDDGDDGGARKLSIVISGAHAQAHIHVSGNEAGPEAGELAEKVEELERAIASIAAEADEWPRRKAARVPEPGPSGLAAILGIASAAVASHSITGAAAVVAIVLAVAPVLWIIAVALPVISGTVVAHRRERYFPALRSLLGRYTLPDDPPAAGRGHRLRPARSERADEEAPVSLPAG